MYRNYAIKHKRHIFRFLQCLLANFAEKKQKKSEYKICGIECGHCRCLKCKVRPSIQFALGEQNAHFIGERSTKARTATFCCWRSQENGRPSRHRMLARSRAYSNAVCAFDRTAPKVSALSLARRDAVPADDHFAFTLSFNCHMRESERRRAASGEKIWHEQKV